MIKTYKLNINSSLAERALLSLGWICWGAEQFEEAERFLRILVRDYPKSSWVSRAEFALENINEKRPIKQALRNNVKQKKSKPNGYRKTQ